VWTEWTSGLAWREDGHMPDGIAYVLEIVKDSPGTDYGPLPIEGHVDIGGEFVSDVCH